MGLSSLFWNIPLKKFTASHSNMFGRKTTGQPGWSFWLFGWHSLNPRADTQHQCFGELSCFSASSAASSKASESSTSAEGTA